MNGANGLAWGSPEWAAVALGLGAVAALATAWSYGRAGASPGVKAAGAILKGLGFAALLLALAEPLLTGSRPRRGANAFAVVVDTSASLGIRDGQGPETRGDWARDRLKEGLPWRTRLGQDYDVRPYTFDTQLRAVSGFDALAFDGQGSALHGSLAALGRRFKGLPLAGVLLFTDGNATDLEGAEGEGLPPIYPVVPPSRGESRDVGVGAVSVSQTNFEAAPVVVQARVDAEGLDGRTIVAVVRDESGREVARERAKAEGAGRPLNFRFQFRPERAGVSFFTVQAFEASAERPDGTIDAAAAGEGTDANNGRLLTVDQGAGPYRVLYVGGRPAWEFKFLRRALEGDAQLDLVGLLRIARRQPKFDFQASGRRTASPLFEGFDAADPEGVERSDQPVLIRLNVADEAELRDGFPKAAEDLHGFSAVVLDDVEAGFFTQDQLALLRDFVGRRGGGLLMLGGPESFADGKYDRTPVGEILPVYLNRQAGPEASEGEFRLLLTREGWLQPWVRTRKTEDDERRRLAEMPPFRTLSPAGAIKPGAAVLAQVADAAGNPAPALVAQPFGNGRVAAMLIGDLWRWGMRRKDPKEDDLDRSWRQAVRWLVADVPGRVDATVRPRAGAGDPAVEVVAKVRDAAYRPLDNAKVTLKLTLPDGSNLDLDAPAAGREAGTYAATYVPRRPGPHRVRVEAAAPDGSAVGADEVGWAAQPAADEFARLRPNREALETLAKRTGGEVVAGDRLDAFVAGLASRDAPITESWTAPLWHRPWYFGVALALLVAEWGLRRKHGLA
jgi:uncharacterized membrane protein